MRRMDGPLAYERLTSHKRHFQQHANLDLTQSDHAEQLAGV